MKKGDKTPKKAKKKGVHVRLRLGTIDWLQDQVKPDSEDADSVPAVVRSIVEEKKKAAQKPDGGG